MTVNYLNVLSQFQVFITYVYIQAMANWVCVKCYPAIYTKSKDRPNPDRKIWEEQQPPAESSQQTERPRLLYNGNELDDKWSEMLDRERTVLSWRWCKICEHHCPPRAHHCRVSMTIIFLLSFLNTVNNMPPLSLLAFSINCADQSIPQIIKGLFRKATIIRE